MNDIEAINIRKSTRNFKSDEIPKDIIIDLKGKIKEINEKNNLDIEVIESGANYFNSVKITYGMFSGVKSVIVLKGKKSDLDLREKIGYYGERLILDLIKKQIGTCWVGGTYDKEKANITISEDEQLIALIPFGYPKEKEKFITSIAMKKMHKNAKTREEMYTSTSDEIPTWFLDGVDAVVKAPSAIMAQPISFSYDGNEVRAKANSERDSTMIDMGIAKLHFEIAANGSFDLGDNALFKKK